jgi:uncharacterized metal-binding protein YceD (DUF177 family)
MSKTSKAPVPYSHVLSLMAVNIPQDHRLVPNAAERAAIAALGSLNSVSAFEAKVLVKPRGDGAIQISGQLEADIEPICVVSLEPFPQHISEEIEAVFAEQVVIERLEKRAAEAELEFDPPDEIVNGVIDIGALAVEFLMLALDPYPKKPGTAFGEHRESEQRESPFAALAKLKERE